MYIILALSRLDDEQSLGLDLSSYDWWIVWKHCWRTWMTDDTPSFISLHLHSPLFFPKALGNRRSLIRPRPVIRGDGARSDTCCVPPIDRPTPMRTSSLWQELTLTISIVPTQPLPLKPLAPCHGLLSPHSRRTPSRATSNFSTASETSSPRSIPRNLSFLVATL